MEIIDPNAEPEIPSFAVPMVIDLPIIGETSTLTVAVIAAALIVILLFLLGFLIGRSGRDDGCDDDDTPPPPPVKRSRENRRYDRMGADPVEMPAPRKAAAPAPVLTEEPAEASVISTEAAVAAEEDFFDVAAPIAVPVAEKKPVEKRKAPVEEDDGFSSPFVEDVSTQVQEELQRREAAADEPSFFVESARSEEDVESDKAVDTMSLQELLDDIRNM